MPPFKESLLGATAGEGLMPPPLKGQTQPTSGISQLGMAEGAAYGQGMGVPSAGTAFTPPTPAPPVSTPTPAVIPKPAPPVPMPQPAAPMVSTSGANITSDENKGFTQEALGGMTQVQPPTPVQPAQPPQPAQPSQPAAPSSPKGGPGIGGGEEAIVGGTALTPATPSATGGGSSALPTASIGGEEGPTKEGMSLGGAYPAKQEVGPPAIATQEATKGPAPTVQGSPKGAPFSEASGGLGTLKSFKDVATPTQPGPTTYDPGEGKNVGPSAYPSAESVVAPPTSPTAPPLLALAGAPPMTSPSAGVSTKLGGGEGAVIGTNLGMPAGTSPATAGQSAMTPPKGEGMQTVTQPSVGTQMQAAASPAVTSTSEYSTPGGGTTAGGGAMTGGGQGQALTSPTGQSLLGATSGGDIASQFGFDASKYGGYFTPISEAMKKAGTEEGYAGMMGEQRAQLRQQAGQSKQGLRASLLQDVMTAQQAGGASGFAGGGAQQQALGLARSGRQLSADQLASQYGRGMYGVRQQIAGRVAAGQQALSKAQSSMYDRALQLQQSGAGMAGTGAGAVGSAGTGQAMTQTDLTATQDPSTMTGPSDTSKQIDPGLGAMDPDNQLTGPAYDAMIAQQKAQAQAAATGQDPSLPAYATQYKITDPYQKTGQMTVGPGGKKVNR